MPRTKILFLQVYEGTCKLDESLEEGMILVLALQPQVLEHIMRFVVFLGIEADEVCQVAGIEIPPPQDRRTLHKLRSARPSLSAASTIVRP